MKHLLQYIVVLLLLSVIDLKADDRYPESYHQVFVEEGAKIIPLRKSDNIFHYSVKPTWSGQNEFLTIWEGIEKNNVKGFSLSNIDIIYSFMRNENLYIISREPQSLILHQFDENMNIHQSSEIYHNNIMRDNFNIDYFSMTDNTFFLLINQDLFNVNVDDKLNISFVSKDVLTTPILNSKEQIVFLKKSGFWTEIKVIYGKDENTINRLQLSNLVKLMSTDEHLLVVSGNKYSSKSWLHLFDTENITYKYSINTTPDLINCYQNGVDSFILALEFDNNQYVLKKYKIEQNNIIVEKEIALPDNLFEPQRIDVIKSGSIILFRNALVTTSLDGEINSTDYITFGNYSENNFELYSFDNFLYFSSLSYSTILEKKENPFWYFYNFIDETGKIVIPTFLIILLLIMYRKYYKQKKLSNALLDLPSSGVVFIIDKKGRLKSTNSSAKKMLNITEGVPYKRIFSFYIDKERTSQLKELIEKTLILRKSFKQKINVFETNQVNEWLFTIYPLRTILGKIKSFVITGIDITEELERRRLNNWAQLAHDMQTNLSTIRLNAEQLDCEENDANQNRRKKIINQTLLLIQRVRDIITVGRSEKLNQTRVNTFDICTELRNEFDDSLFPNIEFRLKINDLLISCDKEKVVRGLRNAVENSIKAINTKNGEIMISTWKDSRSVYFSIKDNGPGMDDEGIKRMTTPYYSSSKDTGGSGIGTMIMQNVVEQHGGKLSVISKPGQGTEVIFIIPNIDRYQ